MTEKKMQGAIKAIFLDDNTFHGVTINLRSLTIFTVKMAAENPRLPALFVLNPELPRTSATLKF